MLIVARTRAAQRGLSLVEMMVGIAVGMFVVAAAATMVATQLSDNRRMLLEVQVQQDLRASADIIARDLRRAGAWSGKIAEAMKGTWKPGWIPETNSNLAGLSPTAGEAESVTFRSSRTDAQDGPYTYVLDEGAIKLQVDGGALQQLTDISSMRVTAFSIAAQNEPAVRIACPKACADAPPPGDDASWCWPTIAVNSFVINITGQSVSDPAVVRSIRSVVRLRNETVSFNDPLNPALACPS